MTIKLQGSSSGHVNLDAKATAANNTITLPDTASGELVAADSSGHINLADNKEIKIGTGGDLVLKHDGSDSYISNVGTGELIIQAKTGETGAVIRTDGAVELFHDNTKQCETSANGLAFPSGKGIDFSATANSGGANHGEILTDYETGTFTPTYGNGTISYNWQRGFYHKIGCMVTVWFDVGFSCSSQSGVPYMGGFPFGKAMNSSGGHYEGISWWHLDDVFTGTKPCANGYMSDSTSTINLYRGDTNQHASGGFVLDQTGRLAGSFSYSATA